MEMPEHKLEPFAKLNLQNKPSTSTLEALASATPKYNVPIAFHLFHFTNPNPLYSATMPYEVVQHHFTTSLPASVSVGR